MEIVYSTIALFLANAGLIVWIRSESRSDWRHMDSKMEAFRETIREDWRHMDSKTDAIHEEIKDFHNRLCQIEGEKRAQEKKV